MAKCEWKNGKFTACKPALLYLVREIEGVNSVFDFTAGVNETDQGKLSLGAQCISYCPFCGANIINPEPEVIPTHKEIMTKWWKDECNNWFRVFFYGDGVYYHYENDLDLAQSFKSYFTGRESADIPPE